MARARPFALVAVLAVARIGVACSGASTQSSQATAAPDASTASTGADAVGSVGMALTIAPGVQFTALSWTISGSSGPYSGNVPVGNAQSVEFVTGGIPAGGPYAMSLTGTDSSGDPCSGSASFFVAAGGVSKVAVTISCFYPTDAGIPADVTVGGEGGATYVAAAYNCPTISSIAASSSQVPVGQG